MVVVVKADVKQIDVHAERLDKCAIVDSIQILLAKINEELLAHGRWFSPGTPASSTTKNWSP